MMPELIVYTPLLAILLMSSRGKGETAAGDLRTANTELYAAEPHPLESPTFSLNGAEEQYRHVLHLYGEIPEARAWLARCHFYHGFYRLAERDFRLAGPKFKDRIKQAEERERLATAISQGLHAGPEVRDVANAAHANALARALHDANVEFYGSRPYPIRPASFSLRDAANDYAALLHRFGHAPAARAGLGRCMLYQGHYARAAWEFRMAGSAYRGERLKALALGRLARSVGRKIGGKNVLSVAPVPGSKLCVALVGNRVHRRYWDGTMVGRVQIVVALRKHGDGCTIVGRSEFRFTPHMGQSWLWRNYEDQQEGSADLYLMRRTLRSKSWCVVLCRDYSSADSAPAAVEVADVTPKGLRKIDVFGSVSGVSVLPADDRHGLLVCVTPTWKVWWPDVYEWQGAEFTLADWKYPDLYPERTSTPEDATTHFYPAWANLAAYEDIESQFDKALADWERAEADCEGNIRTHNRFDGGYFSVGYSGSATVNLKEIRQRIAWLKKHEYNHPLLYRPYDFDIEVPPYRLGTAESHPGE